MIDTKKEVILMHEYRFYVLNNEEYYEIMEDNICIQKQVFPFGDGICHLINMHDSEVHSMISNINYYRNLADIFYSRRSSGNESENAFHFFPKATHFWDFFMDVFEQYQKNEMEVPPKENTWFQYDITDTLPKHSDTFMSMFLFAKSMLSQWIKTDFPDISGRLNVSPIRVEIEKMDNQIVEVLYPMHINDLVYFSILKANQLIERKRLWVIQCRRCDRVFFNFKQGRSVFYCNYKDNNGYSCHDIVLGSFEGWNKSEEEKRIQRTFIRYYNAQRRKLQKRDISKNQLSTWSKIARKVRDTCIAGEITEEDFIKWLDENKENYAE